MRVAIFLPKSLSEESIEAPGRPGCGHLALLTCPSFLGTLGVDLRFTLGVPLSFLSEHSVHGVARKHPQCGLEGRRRAEEGGSRPAADYSRKRVSASAAELQPQGTSVNAALSRCFASPRPLPFEPHGATEAPLTVAGHRPCGLPAPCGLVAHRGPPGRGAVDHPGTAPTQPPRFLSAEGDAAAAGDKPAGHIDATLEELSVQQETEDQNYGMCVGGRRARALARGGPV